MAKANSIRSRMSRAPSPHAHRCVGFRPAPNRTHWLQIVAAVVGWGLFIAGCTALLLPFADALAKAGAQ
jgi:hypothetical protein